MAAQLGLAPSQVMPPALTMVLMTVFSICSVVPPHRKVMPAPAPAAAQDGSAVGGQRPDVALLILGVRLETHSAPEKFLVGLSGGSVHTQ